MSQEELQNQKQKKQSTEQEENEFDEEINENSEISNEMEKIDDEGENQEQENEDDDDQQENQQQGDVDQQEQVNELMISKNKQKGVVYISRIPPYMSASHLRSLLEGYGIERIYLVPEDESKRKMRIQKGGNKTRCYVEGWIEFTDKRVARSAALSLACRKMVNKKNSFYSEDLWHLKYLPKFKWDNLTEKFAYDEKIRKQKIQKQLNLAKKEKEFYLKNLEQSKTINQIQQRMQRKREKLQQEQEHQNQEFQTAKNNFRARNIGQTKVIKRELDEQ